MTKILDVECPLIELAKASGGLGDDFEFVAFLVHLPHSDEFLLEAVKPKKGVVLYKWGRSAPGVAKRFARLKKAREVSKEKEGTQVVILFENASQYIVAAVESE